MEMLTYGSWYLYDVPSITATVILNNIHPYVRPGHYARADELVHKDLGSSYQAIMYFRVMKLPQKGVPEECVARYRFVVTNAKDGSYVGFDLRPFRLASSYVRSAMKDRQKDGYKVASRSGRKPPKTMNKKQ